MVEKKRYRVGKSIRCGVSNSRTHQQLTIIDELRVEHSCNAMLRKLFAAASNLRSARSERGRLNGANGMRETNLLKKYLTLSDTVVVFADIYRENTARMRIGQKNNYNNINIYNNLNNNIYNVNNNFNLNGINNGLNNSGNFNSRLNNALNNGGVYNGLNNNVNNGGINISIPFSKPQEAVYVPVTAKKPTDYIIRKRSPFSDVFIPAYDLLPSPAMFSLRPYSRGESDRLLQEMALNRMEEYVKINIDKVPLERREDNLIKRVKACASCKIDYSAFFKLVDPKSNIFYCEKCISRKRRSDWGQIDLCAALKKHDKEVAHARAVGVSVPEKGLKNFSLNNVNTVNIINNRVVSGKFINNSNNVNNLNVNNSSHTISYQPQITASFGRFISPQNTANSSNQTLSNADLAYYRNSNGRVVAVAAAAQAVNSGETQRAAHATNYVVAQAAAQAGTRSVTLVATNAANNNLSRVVSSGVTPHVVTALPARSLSNSSPHEQSRESPQGIPSGGHPLVGQPSNPQPLNLQPSSHQPRTISPQSVNISNQHIVLSPMLVEKPQEFRHRSFLVAQPVRLVSNSTNSNLTTQQNCLRLIPKSDSSPSPTLNSSNKPTIRISVPMTSIRPEQVRTTTQTPVYVSTSARPAYPYVLSLATSQRPTTVRPSQNSTYHYRPQTDLRFQSVQPRAVLIDTSSKRIVSTARNAVNSGNIRVYGVPVENQNTQNQSIEK